MKIPKKIKAMVWPEPWSSQNARLNFKVIINWPVEDGERYLLATFLWNRDPEAKCNHRTDFRAICSKRQSSATILIKGERSGRRKPLSSMMDWQTSPATCYPEIDQAQEKAMLKWLGVSSMNHGIPELDAWMTDAIQGEKLRQADARGELRDEDVTLCPEEKPAGLERFVRNVVLQQDDTLIYKKGNVRGVCHICGNQVRAEGRVRFRQNYRVNCPICGTKVTCILYTSDAWKAVRVANVATVQLGSDGQTVFVRQWSLMRDHDVRYGDIDAYLDEVARYAVRGNKVAKWLKEYKYRDGWCSMAPCKRRKYHGWVRRGRPSEIYDGTYTFYAPSDFREIVAGTGLQYCDLQGYLNGTYNGKNPIRFLLDWARYPAIEKFWNAGYEMLVYERIQSGALTKGEREAIRWNKATIPESIPFPKRLLKLFPPTAWSLNRVEQVKRLWECCITGLIREVEIRELANLGRDLENIRLAIGHASVARILNYLDQGWNKREYRDYLEQCVRLEMNLDDRRVLFPPDLRTAHQEATDALNERARRGCEQRVQEREARLAEERQNRAPDFAKYVKRQQKFCWTYNGLSIRPPVNEEELVAEGKALHHCVAGYGKRVATGATTILLIREEASPEKSYYTLEWSGTSVIQCRTYCNQCYTQDTRVHDFVEKWVARMQKADRAA